MLFNRLVSRAVHVDLAANYSTEGFLVVLCRFVSQREYPSKLFSYNGSQLVAANKELQTVIEGLDRNQLQSFGAENGLDWKFTAEYAPWQNGCSETLVKSVKKPITGAVGNQVLSFPELQTVLFESANLVNK